MITPYNTNPLWDCGGVYKISVCISSSGSDWLWWHQIECPNAHQQKLFARSRTHARCEAAHVLLATTMAQLSGSAAAAIWVNSVFSGHWRLRVGSCSILKWNINATAVTYSFQKQNQLSFLGTPNDGQIMAGNPKTIYLAMFNQYPLVN